MSIGTRRLWIFLTICYYFVAISVGTAAGVADYQESDRLFRYPDLATGNPIDLRTFQVFTQDGRLVSIKAQDQAAADAQVAAWVKDNPMPDITYDAIRTGFFTFVMCSLAYLALASFIGGLMWVVQGYSAKSKQGQSPI